MIFSASIASAMIGGCLYFAAGFFGPMLLMPSSNQGPLLGILFTGPIGFFLGGALGVIVAALRLTSRKSMVFGVIVGLVASMPFASGWGLTWAVAFPMAGATAFGLSSLVASRFR